MPALKTALLLTALLLSGCAMGHNVLKIRPPLVLNSQQVDMVIQGIDESLAEAALGMTSG